MASELPRYILRNATIFVDRISRIGQAQTVTLPKPKVVTEEVRNAGMIKPRDVDLGYEKLESSWIETSFDPAVIGLFGLAPGVTREFMQTGALVDEDGTVNNATSFMTGFLNEFDPGGWEIGVIATTTFNLSIHTFKLEIAGREVLYMDDFTIRRNGVDQYGSIRAALLL